MPFQRGGLKRGGRKKGSLNKSKDDIRALIDANVDFSLIIGKLVELSQGIQIKKGTEIYSQPPDSTAAKILLEYRFGKAHQQMDVTSDGKAIKAPVINVISTDDSES